MENVKLKSLSLIFAFFVKIKKFIHEDYDFHGNRDMIRCPGRDRIWTSCDETSWRVGRVVGWDEMRCDKFGRTT